MKWISVADRLPEEKQKVLIFNAALEPIHFCEFKNGKFYDVKKECWFGEYLNVTHWMPLPDKPEATLCQINKA